MENRVVALAVLENLIHWPLPNRSGYAALARGSGEDAEDGSATAALVSAGDAEDLSREPRQRKQDRYRAVLLLPHLCHRLGSRWAETEIVPYLVRCAEEDDPQLALVTGMALLGVTLPRRTPLGPTISASSSSSPDASSTFSGATGNNFGAFLSVEDVQPVCSLLAASSAEETRQFAAQVVLPHLFFGVALERDITLESWDLKYVPLSVLQADMTTTATSMEANEAAEYLESEDNNPSWAAGAVDKRDTDGGASSTARLMAAVRKQLLRKHRLTMKARAAAARASSTVSGKDSHTSSSATEVTDPHTPTEEDVRKRCYDLALEDESVQFLWSGGYAALTGPWLFDGSGRLASLWNDVSDACGRCSSGSSASACRVMASFRCFRRHRRRVDNGQTLRGEPPAACLPLSGADLDLYGAAYASDADSGSGDDFFSVNVRARALVAGLVRWMGALAPRAAAATATSPSADAGTSRSARLHADGSLSLFDYLCCNERRDVLRCRWRSLIKILQGFLESPYPGPVAAAVETVSGLLHAIQAALWEAEQQQQQRAKSSSAGSCADPLRNKATSIDAGAEVDAWSGIRVPAEPLLTTAELQTFMHRMTRRHVAYCIAAAVSARTVSMPTSPTATSMKVLTDSMGRLMRSALAAAQELLADLLLRHHVLMKLDVCSATASTTTSESPHHRLSLGASCMMLQVGVGPSESRLASYSAWDVSFASVSTTAGAVSAATPNMPDDATFLMTTTPAADGRTEKGSAKWLPGTLNAVSVFRLHRLVRRALLRALPLCVDFPCIFYSCASTRALSSASTSGTSASAASVFSLSAVCPMLLQVLVPPSALSPLLNVLRVTVELQHQAEKDHAADEKHAGEAAAPTPSTRHVDPAGSTMMAPALWAAMTAAGSVLQLDTAAAEAPSAVEESPASVDFALLEAALDAVQRLMAEAAVQLSAAPQIGSLRSASAPVIVAGAPPSHILDAVCAQLFVLLAACLRWVPRYPNWKARWLIAQRLPRLTATFCLLIVRMSSLAEGADVSAARGPTAHQLRAQTWLTHTLHLLASLWTCDAQFGTAPLHDLVDDEEVEVRCIAARCAARCFGGATEAVLRLSFSAGAGDEKARTKARFTSQQSSLLPSLCEPLLQLLDVIAQCVLVAASDGDTRVLCRSAEALAGLSRTLSLLVVADPSSATRSASSTSTRNEEESPVWARYLHSNTDTLLRLMTDNRPTVQLALVSQLADLLLMHMRKPPHEKRQGQSRNGRAQSQLMGDESDASFICGPDEDGEEGSENDADAPHRSPDEVQYDALLQCLRQLSQHELWRLREQYALLLAHLCGCLLLTAAAAPAPAPHGRHADAQRISSMDFSAVNAGRVSGEGGTDETTRGSVTDAAVMAQQGGADAALWAHTHPLYQLARTELLTLLVAVLFDKVKAVRDAALDAVERMCVQLAVASSRSAASTSVGGSGGARQGSVGKRFGAGYETEGVDTSADAVAAASGSLNANTFVDDVLWPRIYAHAPAWETYLSRSALLRIAMRLRVDKTSAFIPLLDQLARDPVLNVRLVVAKTILEVLLVSAPEVHAMTTPALFLEAKDGEVASSRTSTPTPMSSYKPELPSGTIAYSILMNKPVTLLLAGSGSGNGRAAAVADVVLPPLQFDEVERAGVILQILRQLLKDPSADVRDEAAKALKVCF
ncbi:conserved hypothetical protein [Leishmania infantum JPCM5]|uniref:Uncharacterized protein n=2 Tax=Leishmania infantum TaxID=5671 RepID=A4HUI1_LEIIN|nr:conserved hypothetical protein [Leishmania infantum JPCM5]CAC9457914.1 HEAT_repeat_-_putative [Leishmania infantum]CAM66089.1 conserved hypothetical protein [Leishmania infantum JPCM5]SUZ39706.1 HEAT_repeat_-_putative [Leishmania infantum]|eukprot:XP_001463722.1 conserved hypothetical protein [Leishmania infantum JPCM5]